MGEQYSYLMRWKNSLSILVQEELMCLYATSASQYVEMKDDQQLQRPQMIHGTGT